MPKIGWTLGVDVPLGPRISVGRAVDVNAYDSLHVEVPENDSTAVELQPGGAGKVKLLVITASRYEDLSFKVNNNQAATKSVDLDQPQILAGKGAVELLDPAPKKLFFTNTSTTDPATVEVLVGRNA